MDAADSLGGQAGPNHHGRQSGDVRDKPGGGVKQTVQFQFHVGEKGGDTGSNRSAQPESRVMIHVVAVGKHSGDPPRRGVRLRDVALLLQAGQFLSDSGRGNLQVALVEHHPGTHRRAGPDVAIHQ